MASVVDICNLGLSHIGDRASLSSIDPPEGSAQADHCARYWPIVRDEVLSSFDWGFASRSVEPTQFADEAVDDVRWEYAYALPADFLVAREFHYREGAVAVLYPGSPLFEEGTLSDGTRAIYTASDVVNLRYTRRVSDPTRYPAKVVVAMSYLMASYLAGAVVKGRSGAQMAVAMRQLYDKLVSEAKVVDANSQHNTMAFKPAGIIARQASEQGVTVEDGLARREVPYWAI